MQRLFSMENKCFHLWFEDGNSRNFFAQSSIRFLCWLFRKDSSFTIAANMKAMQFNTSPGQDSGLTHGDLQLLFCRRDTFEIR